MTLNSLQSCQPNSFFSLFSFQIRADFRCWFFILEWEKLLKTSLENLKNHEQLWLILKDSEGGNIISSWFFWIHNEGLNIYMGRQMKEEKINLEYLYLYSFCRESTGSMMSLPWGNKKNQNFFKIFQRLFIVKRFFSTIYYMVWSFLWSYIWVRALITLIFTHFPPFDY